MQFIEKYKSSPYYCGNLNQFVSVNPKTDCSKLIDDEVVSFVPMTNVQEKNNSVEYDLVPYKKVKKGFTVFKKNDIIWAKITPCMQNGKSCTTEKMSTEIGFGSTEFHVIRALSDDVYMPFLWSMLSNENVLFAAQAMFSGSAGQQRVPSSFLKTFPAVLPEFDKQKSLVANLELKLTERNEKIKKAESLNNNDNLVLNKISLSFNQSYDRFAYAVNKSELINRLDSDFYSPKFADFRRQIEESKFDVVSIAEICETILTGFAAGKQDQADDLADEYRVPHLRPFSITPKGDLSFETIKYVPKARLKESDYCRKGEVIFNNTNSPDLVGKTTVFDSELLCAASNHMTRITLKEGINPYYISALFNVFLNIGYWKLLCTNFNNQAGINTETLKAVRIPLPPLALQDEIANEILTRKKQCKELIEYAEKEWQAAKAQFEKELLGE